MRLFLLKRAVNVCLLFLAFNSVFAADIKISFCPVTKIQAGKQWNANLTITNNTSEVLNFKDGTLKFDWQNLESLPYPFTSWSKSGKNVSFSVEGVGNWKSELGVGSTWSKQFAGANFSGVLAFPTSGIFTYNSKDYTIEVEHCSKTEPYELYDATFDFDRDCFIKSPTSNMCLGEGASEIWQGEGVFDAMMPQDRPSWAIGTMVAHRLFTNLAGVEMLSPNFWTATALNESRMTCDPTIVPDQINHWKINSGANTGTGIDTRTDNCFQVLNIGYTQIENNQPDLFGQTNAYGTASYSTVIAGGRYETGALAVAGYHYQDIRYWNQIFCWNANKFYKEAKDPYAIEKVFYHAFHDGPNAGISLLNDIDANYAAAIAATDMNSVISTGGTWSNLGGGSSRKVANFTSLLDGGDGHLYNSQYVDGTQEYYGCYEESIKWTDILYYLDKIKILYPKLMSLAIQAEIKAVFDGLAGGGNVLFSSLGPVIDEIVIQMGGHDPSGYLATQYAASKVCNESPLGVSLRNNDTLCPGEEGILEVWLAGDKNYAVDIKFPDGSIKSYINISQSPFNITIDQPGDYEVVYFEDADEVGDVNCNFASLTVESKNGSVVGWDKSNVDLTTSCATGDLIVTKIGNESVTISYTKDGLAQTDILMSPNETSKNIILGASSGEYIITTIFPNSCGAPINDTITFCGSCIKPQISILTPDTTICSGDTAFVRFNLTGTSNYSLYFKLDGIPKSVTGITNDFVVIPINIGVTLTLDSLIDSNCKNDTITNSISITLNTIPTFDLGNDTSLCEGSYPFNIIGPNGMDAYTWIPLETSDTYSVLDSGQVKLLVELNGCFFEDSLVVSTNALPIVNIGNDTTICAGPIVFGANAIGTGITYKWNDGSLASTFTASTTGNYWVIVSQGLCSDTDSVALVIGGNLVIDLGNDTSICEDATPFVLTVGNYATIDWRDDIGGSASATSFDVTKETEVTVHVIDADGCEGRDTINVTVNAMPIVALGGDASICSTSPNVTFDAGNIGDTYLWSSGETTQKISKGNGDAGDYSVIVTNNGCAGKDTVKLTVSTKLSVDLGVDLEVCTGTTTLLDVGFGAGFTFDWNGNGPSNNQTFTTGKGQVSVVVSDAGGCTGKDTIVITEVNPLAISLGNDTSICIGNPAVVFSMVSGRTDVTVLEWNDASVGFTLSGNATQDYWLAVDSAGCIARDTVALVVNTLPKVNLGADTFICSGTNPTIVLDPGTFVSYQWADITNLSLLGTMQTQNVSTVGDYGVVVVDLNGCVNGDTILIIQENPTVYELGNDTTICPGGNTTVSIPNGLQSNGTWQWLNDNSITNDYIVSNQIDGDIVNVILEYKNEFGCLSNDTVKVTINNNLLIEDLKDTAICEGEDVVFISGYPVAGYTFSWQDGSTSNNFPLVGVKAGDAGMVKVDIFSAEGCSGSETVNLIVNLNPVPGLVNGSICNGQKTILNHGLLNVISLWTPTNETTQTIEVSNAGTYDVVVTDVNNCIGTASAILTVNNPPTVNLGNDKVLCDGAKFNLNTGFDDLNYTNIWSGASTAVVGAIEVVFGGDYQVVVTDVLTGCSGLDTVNFLFNKVPDVNLGNDTALCEGENLDIFSNETNPSYTYLWSTNYGGQSINVSSAGDYVLTVTNGTCSDSDDIKLQINPLPNSKLGNDTILCFEDLPNGLILDPGRVGVNFIWNTTEISQSININKPGVYIVDITSDDGCAIQDMIKIRQDCPAVVWLPNAFTIDGDNLNDNWVIQGRGVSDVKVLVFNRWGELIWTGNGIGDFWDGTFKGKPVQQDVYVYKLTYNYLNVNEALKTQSRVGKITLIR